MTRNLRQTVTAAEAKSHFADSLRVVEQGGVVVITRYGKPVAALVNYEELVRLDLRSNQGLGRLVGRFADAEDFASELDTLERDRLDHPPVDLD